MCNAAQIADGRRPGGVTIPVRSVSGGQGYSLLPQKMPHRRYRVIDYHPFAAPPHHCPYTFTHIFTVAMYHASATGRFPVSVRTSRQPRESVCQ